MKLHYYAETDSLYIDLKDEPGTKTVEISENLHIDVNEKGDVVGIDIDHASKQMDLNSLEMISLPTHNVKVA